MLTTKLIPELDSLRVKESAFEVSELVVENGKHVLFEQAKLAGNELDIELTWSKGGDCGLYVLSDGEALQEFVRIGVNFANEGPNSVYVDNTRASLDAQYQPYEFTTERSVPGWNGKDEVKLRVLVDHSVLTVFVNDGVMVLTRRAYPSKYDFHVGVYAYDHEDGVGCTIGSLRAWNVSRVNPLP